jgi:glycine betaine/proline transport system substrate-binding protein
MKLFKKITALAAVFTLTFSLAACAGGSDDTITLAAGDWESVQIHNEIAMYIMEHGYDQDAEQVIADTPAQVASLRNGSFHMLLEMWQANVSTYDDDIAAGEYHEVSVNFIDPGQGLYIPKYLQDEYNIHTIQDLNDHKELFEHAEATGDKGLVFGGPEGWAATDFLNTKFSNEEDYPELSQNFEFYPMGSTAVLNQRLQQAYDNEEPWVGYHWAPTWPHAVMDLVFLEDEIEYVAEDHETRAVGDLPAGDVTVVVTDGFEEDYPEIHAFISNYATSTTITSEIINYAQGEGIENRDAAIWFLENYQEVWTEWVPQDVQDKVLDALANE